MHFRTTFVPLAVTLVIVAAACATPAEGDPPGVVWPDETGAAWPDETATPGSPIADLEHWAAFDAPMSVRTLPGDDAWYVVERAGRIWRDDGSERSLALDISDEITVDAEKGLFDVVGSRDGGHVYVSFKRSEDGEIDGPSHVREYVRNGSSFESPREVLVVDNPYEHHNGGQLQIGPDGYLYVSLGDGGVPNPLDREPGDADPHDFGQRTDVLLGKVLRIDPRPSGDEAYTIPDDNPFVGQEGRDEIWAYGLRNPWRFSFDRQTGDLWIADVGESALEEINFQPAGSSGGQNYGWSRMEGSIEYLGGEPDDHVMPVYVYPQRDGPCAIIGGYVYRGSRIPELYGAYVFGDWCTGRLQALEVDDGRVVGRRYLGVEVTMLVGLGEDRDGELFVLSHSEGVFRLVSPGSG